MMKKFNPFHMVDNSPWPLLSSLNVLCLAISLLLFLCNSNVKLLILSTLLLLTNTWSWWRDTHRESVEQGNHSIPVVNGLKMGMIMFIISEIFLFISFFWSLFHSGISPTPELGQYWPPENIVTFNPLGLPLLNTVLLLSSGVSITWSHHVILKGNFVKGKKALFITISLGLTFTLFQGMEYLLSSFCISDSVYGSVFFMLTGIHGMHVIVGSVFLLTSKIRFNKLINTPKQILGFELATWYWHFVDVIWLFLYILMYWWSI